MKKSENLWNGCCKSNQSKGGGKWGGRERGGGGVGGGGLKRFGLAQVLTVQKCRQSSRLVGLAISGGAITPSGHHQFKAAEYQNFVASNHSPNNDRLRISTNSIIHFTYSLKSISVISNSTTRQFPTFLLPFTIFIFIPVLTVSILIHWMCNELNPLVSLNIYK